MTRILLVETASSKRIIEKADQILRTGAYPDPEITVLCRKSTRAEIMNLPGTEIFNLPANAARSAIRELNRRRFDIAIVFWTGEAGYRRMKLLAWRLKAGKTLIIGGDGNEFLLTWKALCRHTVFRWKHPLPSDHYHYVRSSGVANRVLLIQSAEPPHILQALDQFKRKPVFDNPRYSIFCRNDQDAILNFRRHPMIERVIIHSETRDSWEHLKNLRRMKFDTIVVFMTGDPSYWKIKLFSFLLGVPFRRILVINEAGDGFFFSLDHWISHILRRIQEQPQPQPSGIWLRMMDSVRILASLALKSVLLPFRFLWLHLVWLRLRLMGMRSLRKDHDYTY